MITYSSLRMIDVYQIVFSNINNIRKASNIDYTTIKKYINDSIKCIIASTLPYKDWEYVARLSVSHQTQLPREYIKHLRVLLSETGSPPYSEARYVDPLEYHYLTDWYQGHSWNKASKTHPVFTLWGTVDVNGNSRLTIYLAPNTDDQTGTVPTGYTYYTYTMSGFMEYYAFPADLINDTDLIGIPYEYEDYFLNYVLSKVYSALGEKDMTLNVYKQLMAEQSKIVKLYQEKIRTEKRELESYTDETIPIYARKFHPHEVSKSIL